MHKLLREQECKPPFDSRSGVLTFSLVSVGTRAGYAVMLSCISAASVLTYIERHRLPILGMILVFFSLLVLCYVDRWSFNCTRKTVECRIGFAFYTVSTQYRFSDVENTETEHFIKGFFNTPFTKCVLYLRSGEKKVVAIFPEHNKKLSAQWEAIASVMSK